jgi:ABC-type glycerol-3-phosphate transport system substrate-binding protein
MEVFDMKKSLSHTISFLIVFSIIFSLCSCIVKETADKSVMDDTANPETAPLQKQPTEFTMFYQESGAKLPDGFKHNDNWFINFIKEKANVEITELTVPAYFDTATNFNLMMASGNIPDLVERADAKAMKQYGYEGAFLPTEEIIRGSQVISKFYDDVQVKAMRSQDDVAYIIQIPPIIDDFDCCMFCRWDLLQKLGYTTPPSTLDEWVEAARKLKEYDPSSLLFTSSSSLSHAKLVFIPFNLTISGMGWKYYPERGRVCHVWEGDNIVRAVQFGKMLYEEGLWDKEFPTNSTVDMNEKLKQNNVLVHFNNLLSVYSMTQSYFESGNYEAKLLPVETPIEKDVGVNVWNHVPAVLGPYAFGINKTVKGEKLEGIIRFLEVLYSEDVKNFAIYGREGIEYEIVNNEKIPIYPAASTTHGPYGWISVNNKDLIDYYLPRYIGAITVLNETEKKEYVNSMRNATNEIRKKIYGNVGYNPLTLANELEDNLKNLVAQIGEEQYNALLKTILGEMDISEFVKFKEHFLEKYQNITDAYNEVTEEAKIKYGLK